MFETTAYKYENKSLQKIKIYLPEEVKLAVYVNSEKFVNILCSPIDVEDLIIGFLYAENIIDNYNDIEKISFDNDKVEVNLNKEFSIPEEKEKTYTSGFGKGVMFQIDGKKVTSKFKINPESIIKLMNEFIDNMEIYKISGAVHASCLADEDKVLVVKEDIGRHNTIDKIAGYCLKNKISTKNKIIFTTGRISTEMLLKSSKMQIPVVVTMKSPTSNTVKVAKELGITVVGKVKNNSFVVFTNRQRLVNVS